MGLGLGLEQDKIEFHFKDPTLALTLMPQPDAAMLT